MNTKPLDLEAIRKRAEAALEFCPLPWVTWISHPDIYSGTATENRPSTIRGTSGKIAHVVDDDAIGDLIYEKTGDSSDFADRIKAASCLVAAHIAGMDPTTTLSLLAALTASALEVERLREHLSRATEFVHGGCFVGGDPGKWYVTRAKGSEWQWLSPAGKWTTRERVHFADLTAAFGAIDAALAATKGE